MASTWAIEWPALAPTTPTRSARRRTCSSRGQLVVVAVEAQRVENARGAEQSHDRPGATGSRPSAAPRRAPSRRGVGARAVELLALLGESVDDLQRRVLAQDAQHLALERLATSMTSGRREWIRVWAGSIGDAGAADGPASELLGLAPQRLLVLGRAELVGVGRDASRPRPCGSARRERARRRADLASAGELADGHEAVARPPRWRTRRRASSWRGSPTARSLDETGARRPARPWTTRP